ncbi:DUF3369 domain-containing protein [Tissierella sp. MSJ-40]|uniref:DUF3369 domain-containing protein n=1 Tax=Tissierella simiarum TaxID=2841534 RepID=A0ABS6E347_9FIRM|nr:DUF3369 domain-containing protein [Tissierella simiarum]
MGKDSCEVTYLGNNRSWKILIVDDDNFIHRMIKEINKDFKFEDKPLEFLSAYSSEEALNLLSANKDIALVLLDVFIENEKTGLNLTKYIREVLNNMEIRIVLMTGRGSSQLQEDAIVNYDINGYEIKTELFSKKMYTVIIASLRSYRDIIRINNNRKAMEEVVSSSSSLFETSSVYDFITDALCHLSSIINLCKEKDGCTVNAFAATRYFGDKSFKIISGHGKYLSFVNNRIKDVVLQEDFEKIKEAYRKKDHLFFENSYISYYNSSNGVEGIIFIETDGKIDHVDKALLDVFHRSISAAFENLCLNIEIEETQKEILYILGEVTEARSEETGNHVKRVSKYCKLLAEEYGLSKREVMLLTYASPIHDIGKVAIPDNILLKPGRLTPEEFEIVKTHTTIGYNLLESSHRQILKTAAIVAHEHHERYDGKGYPKGLKGEEIHIYGRITAVADVFDALGSPRVYKKTWVINDILQYFQQEKGKHFDPKLVDILFSNLDKFLEIKQKYSDENTKVIGQASDNISES